MSGCDPGLSWEEINDLVYSGRTTWIYTKSKTVLTRICDKFGVEISAGASVEIIR